MSGVRQGSQFMEVAGETGSGSPQGGLTFDQVMAYEPPPTPLKPAKSATETGEHVVDGRNSRRVLPPLELDQLSFLEKPAAKLEPIAERQKEIAAKYKVQFVPAGQLVPRFWKVEKGAISRDQMIEARKPTLKELDGLEAALKRSIPSQVKADGTGVKIAFLPENSPNGTLASFWAPQNLVMVTPGIANLPATISGDMRFEQKLDTIEAVLTHEFSHNHEDKLLNSGTLTEAKYGPSAGWIRAKDTNTWMLLAKDGSYFAYEGNNVWTKRNESGERVGSLGNSVQNIADSVSINNDEMRKVALIKPVTGYFDNPLEMYAEAMMMFRIGSEQRKFLATQSPLLYEIVKENDQAEISNYFGRTPFGNPRYFRDTDGIPRPDSPELRKRIADLEK